MRPRSCAARLRVMLALVAVGISFCTLGQRTAYAAIQPIYSLPFFGAYTVTCWWGPYSNCDVQGGGNHNGTDYSLGGNTTPGENVVAALGGTACQFDDFDPITHLGCGYYLVMVHGNGHKTRYCHLNDRTVASGQAVV